MDLAILHKQMLISDIYARKWFNEGKRYLSYEYDTACKRFTTIFEVVDSAHIYELSSGCLRIKSVIDENGDPYLYSVSDDATIRFKHNGKYSVTYLVEPADFTGLNISDTIRGQYHTALAKYIASRELADVKPSKAKDLYMEFLNDAASVDRRLKRMSKSTINPRPVPKFR